MSTAVLSRPAHPTRGPGLSRLPRLLLAPLQMLAMVRKWRLAGRERRLLAGLDDRMLRDIGLTRAQARREAARPFWEV